jgi:hypothetical protein
MTLRSPSTITCSLHRSSHDSPAKAMTPPSMHSTLSAMMTEAALNLPEAKANLTDLDETRALLALAEDIIIGLQSGIGSSLTRRSEGVWARENDKAGLRELRGRPLQGGGSVGLGRLAWFE